MAVGVPTGYQFNCPRCKALRPFPSIDGGVVFRCGGCEWSFTLGTQAPTGVTNAVRTAGAATIPVASGGASFTAGMILLIDTGQVAEVVTATATGSATSVPVTPFLFAHGSATAFGQLLLSSTLGGVGQAAVPGPPTWGF